MGSPSNDPPFASGPLAIVEWRLAQVERTVSELTSWREKAGEQSGSIQTTLGRMDERIEQNTRALNRITIIISGTFITALGSIVAYLVTAGHIGH